MNLAKKLEKESMITLPSGEQIDIVHFEEYSDWRIRGKEMPLLFTKPEEYFAYALGEDWATILRLEDQLGKEIMGREVNKRRTDSGWWGYSLKFMGRGKKNGEEGAYIFHCMWGCDEPCDPGLITERYITKPTISIQEEKEIDAWSPYSSR